MKGTAATLLLLALLGWSPLALGDTRVVVNVAPPTARKEVVAVRPGPDHVWIAGFWKGDGKKACLGGREVVSGRPGHAWAPGHWKKVPGGYTWIEGHWRKI